MPERMGVAYWPGVKGFISCSYTVSHDAGAGVASLEIPEQDVSKILSYGDLVITDGFGTVTLKGCRLADIRFSASPTGGRTIVLLIADRRWRWRYGAISGNWNQVDPYPDPELFPPGEYVFAGGPYAPGTFRFAHLLMADCLRAMNETALPLIDPAPVIPVPVQWDYEVPASALSSLCATLGYRLVYQPVADRVLCAPAGVGKVLPDNLPIITNHATLDLPRRPAAIKLVGGPTLWHDYLSLEPVGFEKNGEVRPIDKLSYKPAAGWANTSPPYFGDVQATNQLSFAEAVELTKQHVWRTFRVKMVDVVTGKAPGPNVGGYGRIFDRKQLVLGQSIYDGNRGINGQPMTEPAWCVGSIYIPPGNHIPEHGITTAGGNTDAHSGKRLPYKPAVDTDRGLVMFERCMYRMINAKVNPPDLYIFTSFSIRSIVGRIPVCYERGGVAAGAVNLGCPPEYLKHPELVAVVRTIRKDRDFSVTVVGDNFDELNPLADYYLNAANRKYEIGAAADRTYAGIVPLDPDGAIQQVTWSVGGGQPATTRASRNCEHAHYLPAFPERRKVEENRRFVERQLKLDAKEQAPPPHDPKHRSQNENPFPYN